MGSVRYRALHRSQRLWCGVVRHFSRSRTRDPRAEQEGLGASSSPALRSWVEVFVHLGYGRRISSRGSSCSDTKNPLADTEQDHLLRGRRHLRYLIHPTAGRNRGLICPGVIMAIVFSSRITGDVADMYSTNNYYTGPSSTHLSPCFCANQLTLPAINPSD